LANRARPDVTAAPREERDNRANKRAREAIDVGEASARGTGGRSGEASLARSRVGDDERSRTHGGTLARPLRAAERGCLVIADVTGYTSYLQGTELEHAQDVLADLLETVVGRLEPTLRLSKLEGDAAFVYGLEDELEPSMLLDTVDEAYFAFRRRVRDIRQATTCDCNACRLIPSLDLKLVAHHGSFVRQTVAGREELAGSDVILVHRLLKSSVDERLGLRGYALFTEPCLRALGLDPDALELREHREQFPDVGEVVGYVADLDARWRYEDERRRVFVLPSEAEFEDVDELPAPPPVVWEFITSPEKRAVWAVDATRIDEWQEGGRRGPGTTTHCVHGKTAIVEEILDWRPFRYFTLKRVMPGGLGPWMFTTELRPLGDDATEVRVRGERLVGLRRRVLWRLMRRSVTNHVEQEWQRLRQMLIEHQAARRETQPAA
jgi:hypothetical protein